DGDFFTRISRVILCNVQKTHLQRSEVFEPARYYFPVHSGRNTPAPSSPPIATECRHSRLPLHSSLMIADPPSSRALDWSPSRASSACKLFSINLSMIFLLKPDT